MELRDYMDIKYYRIEFKHLIPFKGLKDYIKKIENQCLQDKPETESRKMVLGVYNALLIAAIAGIAAVNLEKLVQ